MLGSDAFRARLTAKSATCARGTSAAEMFYQPDRFTWQGAMPPIALRLLQDVGSVQPHDGDAHRHRKATFMAMMTPERRARLVEIADEE